MLKPKLKTCIAIISLIGSTTLTSQTKAKDFGFSAAFDKTDTKKRYVYSSTPFNTKIENGSLYLDHNKEGKSYFISEFTYIDYRADFNISTNFKLEHGTKSSTFGILFGGSGISNSFVFIINNFGQYCFFKYKKDVIETIKEWTSTPNLKQDGELNTIDIKCEKGNYNFYINSKLTYTCKAIPFYGFDVGYYVSGVTSAWSDYFTVYQKQKNSINLIEKANSFGKKINLGPEINSSDDEFSPIISSDEKTLYITRKPNKGEYNNKGDEDIWYAEYNAKDSNWHHIKNIGKPLNNSANNFIQAVSADNSQIITGNLYNANGEFKGLGFSTSHRTKTGWSIPKDIHIKNYYNKHKYNEICLSPNGHVMLLAIERDETFGSKDLYVSFMQADSSWSEPKNIGKTVNTFADETSPFIAADGITMYFATAGHPGYGDNDIFLTKRLDDTWLNWSTPKNLGPIINADTWDSYYTVPASGKNAYLVSSINGNSDIYVIKQPESAKPNPVVLIKGYVFNSETKQPIEASIHYSELGNKKLLGHFKSDPKTGLFTLSLPKGKKYSFIADKQDFISVHENIDLVNLKNYTEQELDLYITPIKKGQSIVINNLFFTANKAEILPESFPELDKIIDILKINPRIRIVVSGHTSKNNSTTEWNLNLSTNRALSVKNYFVKNGIAENRIQHIGYGSDKPINKLAGEANLAKNRRVEFEILEH